MGGRFGDGPVIPDAEDAPVFAEDWHARALALTLAAGGLGQWNLDISRHARERLSPKDYSRFSYYEKWLAALADLLVERDVLTLDELKQMQGSEGSPLVERTLTQDRVQTVLASGGPVDRPGPSPKFKNGDKIRTRHPAANEYVAGGHTRLPSYASGQTGTIIAHHGCHVFPDSNAHDLGENPQPIYAVAFKAADLWGKDHVQNGDEVILDLWEPYLEAVDD
jgi:nitrile hydratase